MSENISKKIIAESYDKEAPNYDKTRWGDKRGKYHVSLEYEYIKKFLKKGSILRLGIGTAHFEILLAKDGFRDITGIDISDGMMNRAREKIRKEKLDKYIRLVKMDSDNLAFKNTSFDNVVCVHGFQWMGLKTLKESYRVLKPKGRLIIIYPSGDFIFNKFPNRWAQKTEVIEKGKRIAVSHCYAHKEMEKMFQESNLKIIHHKSLFVFPPGIYNRLPWCILNLIKKIDDKFKNGGRLNVIVGEKL